MFLRLSIPPQNEEQRRRLAEHRALMIPEPIYGGQLQGLAIQGHRAEGRMHIEYEENPVLLADGETASLRKPAYTVTNWNYGPPHPELLLPLVATSSLSGRLWNGASSVICAGRQLRHRFRNASWRISAHQRQRAARGHAPLDHTSHYSTSETPGIRWDNHLSRIHNLSSG